MRKSLLDITQDILNDLDADAVNSINDTIESQQVAQIIRTCYENLIAPRNWPHLKKIIQLEAADDINKPNYLRVPASIKEVESIRYDCQKLDEDRIQFKEIKWKEPDSFLRLVSQRNSTLSTVSTVVDFSGTQLLILNNQHPTYYTSFDDDYVVFDSYDEAVDSTLKKSKSQCIAYVHPTWEHVDDFIPDLPTEAFPALIEEAKSTSFVVVKQVANQKAEQKARKQERWLSRKAWQVKGGIVYPNYGRRR